MNEIAMKERKKTKKMNKGSDVERKKKEDKKINKERKEINQENDMDTRKTV